MEIVPFDSFFIQLSRVSDMGFHVCDGVEPIFSSYEDGRQGPPLETVQRLSRQIMAETAFGHLDPNGGYLLYGIPLAEKEKVIGSLILSTPKITPKTADDDSMEAFLSSLSTLMEETWAAQRESEQMAEEIAQYFEDLSLYGRISSRIRSLKFSGPMLRSLLEDLLETMRVDLAFVRLPRRLEYDSLVGRENVSSEVPDPELLVDRLLKAVPEEFLQPGRDYYIVNDSTVNPEFKKLCAGAYRFLAVKIRHEDHLDGWLGLVSFNMKEIFRQSELRLLQNLTMQISVLLANLDLYHELERFVVNMVRALVYAIEAKDTYTRGHSERVNRYCMLMADHLGLDKKQKEALNWASILHDIGKIGIPESVLNKPARLDEKEFEIIKGHPRKGSNILRPLVEQLSSSIPGIVHHHERYDGTGYPGGLKGEEIPFFARLIAIADTFDAINSTRAYRPALGHKKAMQIIEEVAGTQLDPELVKVFKEVYVTRLSKEMEKHPAKPGEGGRS